MNTDRLVAHIFRVSTVAADPVRGLGYDDRNQAPGNTDFKYVGGNISLMSTLSGTSWVVAAGLHRTATDAVRPLAGMTLVNSSTLPDLGVYSSEAGRTTEWAPVDFSPVNASGQWGTGEMEIKNVVARISTTIYNGVSASVDFDWPPGTQEGDVAAFHAWSWFYPGAIPRPLTGSTGYTEVFASAGLVFAMSFYSKIIPTGAFILSAPFAMISDVMV